MDKTPKPKQRFRLPDIEQIIVPATSATPEVTRTPASAKSSPTHPIVTQPSPNSLQIPSPKSRKATPQWLLDEIAKSTPFKPSSEAVIQPLFSSRKSSFAEIDVLGLFPEPLSLAPQGLKIVAMSSSGTSSGGSTAGGSSANTTPEQKGRRNLKKAPTSNPGPKSDPKFDPPPGEEKEDGDETKKTFGGKTKIKLAPPKFVSNDPKIMAFKSVMQGLDPKDACYDVAEAANEAIHAALMQKVNDPLKAVKGFVEQSNINQNYVDQLDVLKKKLEAYENGDGEVGALNKCEAETNRLLEAVALQRDEITNLTASNDAKDTEIADLKKQLDDLRKVNAQLAADNTTLRNTPASLKTYKDRNLAREIQLIAENDALQKALVLLNAPQDDVKIAKLNDEIDVLEAEAERLRLSNLLTVEEHEEVLKGMITLEDCEEHAEELNKDIEEALAFQKEALEKCNKMNRDYEAGARDDGEDIKGLQAKIKILEEKTPDSNLLTEAECEEKTKAAVAPKDQKILNLELDIENMQKNAALNNKTLTDEECAEKYSKEKNALLKQIANLEKEVHVSQELVDDLDKQIKVNDIECARKKQEIADALNNRITELEQEINDLKNKPESDKTLTEAECTQRNQDAINVLNETINDLNKQIDVLNKAPVPEATDKTLTEAECTDKNKKIVDDLKEQITQLNEQVEDLGIQLSGRPSAKTMSDDECDRKYADIVNKLKLAKKNLWADVQKFNTDLNEARKKVLTYEECDAIYEEKVGKLKKQIKQLEDDAVGLIPQADAENSLRIMKDQLVKAEKEAKKALQDLADCKADTNMITLDDCATKNQLALDALTADVARVTAQALSARTAASNELVRMTAALEAAKKAASIPDPAENQTLRRRIAELDREVEKYKKIIAELRKRGLLAAEANGDLEKCNKDKAKLETTVAMLKSIVEQQKAELAKPKSAEQTMLENNLQILKRQTEQLLKSTNESQAKEIAATREKNIAIRERDEFEASVEGCSAALEILKKDIERLNAEIKNLRSNDVDQKLKDCWARRDYQQTQLNQAQYDLEREQEETAKLVKEIAGLQEDEDALNREKDDLEDELEAANKKLEAAEKKLEDSEGSEALSKCTKKVDDLEDQIKKLKEQITEVAEKLTDVAINAADLEEQIEALTNKVQALEDENKRLEKKLKQRPAEDTSQDTDAINKLRNEIAKATRQLAELDRKYQAIKDQNGQTDALNRRYQELLRKNRIAFPKPGDPDAPDSLSDDGSDSDAGSAGKEPKTALEAEVAILRAQIELSNVLARRAVTGFVDNDTDLARQAITRALEMVSYIPHTGHRQLHAEAHFWNFFILYYSNDDEAFTALRLAAQWRVDLNSDDQRDSISEWIALPGLPECPRAADGYAAGDNMERVGTGSNADSDSDSDKKPQKKSKKSKGKRKERNETDEERKERRKKRKQAKKDKKDKKDKENEDTS